VNWKRIGIVVLVLFTILIIKNPTAAAGLWSNFTAALSNAGNSLATFATSVGG
jgi:hypothetical protein